jgi:hypothetical protein
LKLIALLVGKVLEKEKKKHLEGREVKLQPWSMCTHLHNANRYDVIFNYK